MDGRQKGDTEKPEGWKQDLQQKDVSFAPSDGKAKERLSHFYRRAGPRREDDLISVSSVYRARGKGGSCVERDCREEQQSPSPQ